MNDNFLDWVVSNKELSLDQKASKLRDTVYRLLPRNENYVSYVSNGVSPSIADNGWWVREIYETYVVVSESNGSNCYRFDFVKDDKGEIVGLENKKKVEMAWVVTEENKESDPEDGEFGDEDDDLKGDE